MMFRDAACPCLCAGSEGSHVRVRSDMIVCGQESYTGRAVGGLRAAAPPETL